MFEYYAKVTRVVDGDTLDVEIDLGFGIKKNDRLRILNLDTPEKFGRVSDAEKEHGEEATLFAKEIVEGKKVIVRTMKDRQGKYGRYLADVTFDGKRDYAQVMKDNGFEKRESYE